MEGTIHQNFDTNNPQKSKSTFSSEWPQLWFDLIQH